MLSSNVQSIDLLVEYTTDGSGRWDNRVAAQHLPRNLARPSSEERTEELAQKKKKDWIEDLKRCFN